jgi:hypothetical protein
MVWIKGSKQISEIQFVALSMQTIFLQIQCTYHTVMEQMTHKKHSISPLHCNIVSRVNTRDLTPEENTWSCLHASVTNYNLCISNSRYS